MTLRGIVLAIGVALLMINPVAGKQASVTHTSQATAFMGTWLFDMTEPAALVGSTETIGVFEKNGAVAATVQVGRFPPNEVTGIMRDGDLLVLTTTLRENGQPIWVAIALKRTADAMTLAQMMERSQTIKRGVGKKQAD